MLQTNNQPLKIGQVATLCQVSVETIRYYETQNLIPSPARSESGYRQYPSSAVERIHFILRAKQLGFSLHEIRELLELKAADGPDCHHVKEQIESKIERIKQKLSELEKMKRSLEKLSSFCDGTAPIHDCPILYHLAKCDEEDCCHEQNS